ncbi:hypothetical protein CPB86DRAFT_824436 [Serendipita vermifera]|nr:hypothetical protein CPB86DRAFT_824436 [Serendipita vermifera]
MGFHLTPLFLPILFLTCTSSGRSAPTFAHVREPHWAMTIPTKIYKEWRLHPKREGIPFTISTSMGSNSAINTTINAEIQSNSGQDLVSAPNDPISSSPGVDAELGVVSNLISSLFGTPVLGNVPVETEQQSSNGSPKLVVAHHMVGNTYPYSVDDWKRDIQLASSHGIDGFALNIGKEEWMTDRVADAYTAAQSIGSTFKLFLSLDMSSLPCATKSDMNNLQEIVSRFSSHLNQLLHKGKPLVSTFAGETCTYGGGLAAFWAEFKNGLNGNVHFVPSFFVDPGQLGNLSFLDGAFNWNGGWPTQLNAASSLLQIEQAMSSLTTDHSYFTSLVDNTYIAPVSPWFFTHYGPDTWNKNWIYRADDWLYARRWEELVEMRDQIDIVEIITWNDYGESHYIGPIAGAQPNSQAWVDGFDHQGWLELSTYYIEAFKTGAYPPITQDKVFLWARPHPRDATAPDHIPRPNNAELTEDFFWVIVFAKEPCTAILYTPDPASQPLEIDYKAAMVIDIPSGINKLRYPLQPNKSMAIRLEREGNTVVDYVAEGYSFNLNPQVYNFNAWVGWKLVQ